MVIGVPDPAAGELPMAYIVSKNEDDLTEIEVMEYVDENAAPHKKLRGGVEFITEIPKTVDGRVLRAELLERQRKGRSRAVLLRRATGLWNEDKRFSLKRHSIGPSIKIGHNRTIVEETRGNVVRSQSCVLL